MKLSIKGDKKLAATQQQIWDALIDPEVLTKCIPGCKTMTETSPDNYFTEMQLKVAAVGGSFEGEVGLSDKDEPNTCRIEVSGTGSLGTGSGTAAFTIVSIDEMNCRLDYVGEGEVGGLVAGVGQRILGSVSKILIKQFFGGLENHFEETASVPDSMRGRAL
jgi:carbon monoxide dehydrogenase subunit G